MTEYLIDLASYQHGINLAVVKAAGFSKVNIKLTQGTSYVDPYIGEFVTGARAQSMDIGTFHWLDGRSSGAAQAQVAQAQMVKWGLRYGTAHQCDCEDTKYPATWAVWRDYMNAMQDWLGRPVINYTGDWWWPIHMAAGNGPAITPYLWAAPDHGYDSAYPGDASADWHADYGGWGDYAGLQYAVGPIANAGGGNLSKTAFRDPRVWTALTGVDAATTNTSQEDDMLTIVLARDANGTVYKCNGVESVQINDGNLIDAFRRLDAFGSIKLMKSPTGQPGPGWYASDIADSWSPELFGQVVTAPAVTVAMTDADRAAIIAGVTAQLGGKLDEVAAAVAALGTREAAAAQAEADALKG